MRQISLDTETTGRDPDKGDRLVEIGCVALDGRHRPDEGNADCFYHTLVNPEREVPEEVVKIHGLTTERLSTEPRFAEVADAFLDFVRGSELIIHNAEFDVGFIDMELARKMRPGQRNSLDALCDAYGIDRSSRTLHGALLDAWLLAEVYLKLTQGQGSLMIETSSGEGGETLLALPDPSLLRVIRATPDEIAAHEEQLDKIDKACKGTCVWRKNPDAEPENMPGSS